LKKKCKICKIEDEEYENANVPMGNEEINGIEHITIGCPKCKTSIAIPIATIRLFLIVKHKQQGVV